MLSSCLLTTIEKSIDKLVSNKELSKNSLVYKWFSDLKSVLRKLRIEFIEGNDAPRGGKTGYFVQITTKII